MTEQPSAPLDHAPLASDPEATMPLPPPPPRPHPEHRPPGSLIAGLAAGVLVAGAVLVMLIGRIGHEPAEAAESAPHTFTSPRALVEYLDHRGLECDGYEVVDAAGSSLGRGRCMAAGHSVGVGVYAIHSDVEAQWSALAGHRDQLFMALGENWAIDGPAEWTKRVAAVMNAQYRAQP